MATNELNARQRYGITQVRDYGNCSAIPTVTTNSLYHRGLIVAMDPTSPRRHAQLTPEGWAMLTPRDQAVTIDRAHEQANADARQAGA